MEILMNKNVNVYSFNEECYVYLGDYIKLLQEKIDIFDTLMKDSNVNEYTKMLIKLLQENKQLKAQIEEYQKALDETISEKMDIENN